MNELKYALRSLRKSPGYAAIAILTLALGIGVTTGIFSVVDAVLLRPLPYRDPARLATVWKSIPLKNIERDWTSYPTYFNWKNENHVFEDLALFIRPDGAQFTLTGQSEPETVQGALVSRNFFSVTGATAAMGRTFAASDLNGVVLSQAFWKQRFGGANALGQTIEIDHARHEIIGVMPPDFALPPADLWMLIDADARWPRFQVVRLADAFGAVGRLKPGVSPEQAQADMNLLGARLAREFPVTDSLLGIKVVPLSTYVIGSRVREILWIFLVAVILILLIACANVAGVAFARSFSRRKQFAVQMALGAGRARIVRQLMAETTVLAIAAGILGAALASAGIKALVALAPAGIPGLDHVALNAKALAFTLAISLVAGNARRLRSSVAIFGGRSPGFVARPRLGRRRSDARVAGGGRVRAGGHFAGWDRVAFAEPAADRTDRPRFSSRPSADHARRRAVPFAGVLRSGRAKY